MSRWHGANEHRESWCFLIVDTVQDHNPSYVTGWALGDGNADQLLETDQQVITGPSAEADLLMALGEELDARRYQDTTLITPTQGTLAVLRARFFDRAEVTHPTLRGYRHIALSDLLDEYIDTSAIHPHGPLSQIDLDQRTVTDGGRVGVASAVERLWELRVKLGPLVPAEALHGRPL